MTDNDDLRERAFDAMAFLNARLKDRRALIEQIIHECPKLSGEPSRDCVAALSGVAVGEAIDTLKEAGIEALQQRVERLEVALRLAANRLHRCAVDYDTGTLRFIETGEWADEARAALGDDVG